MATKVHHQDDTVSFLHLCWDGENRLTKSPNHFCLHLPNDMMMMEVAKWQGAWGDASVLLAKHLAQMTVKCGLSHPHISPIPAYLVYLTNDRTMIFSIYPGNMIHYIFTTLRIQLQIKHHFLTGLGKSCRQYLNNMCQAYKAWFPQSCETCPCNNFILQQEWNKYSCLLSQFSTGSS